MSNLFQRGDFTLASGRKAAWKIECDGLTDEDWSTLALMAVERWGVPADVCAVPSGGLPFQKALRPYVKPGLGRLWIVDDVLTTGESMKRRRYELVADWPGDVLGVVAFSRGAVLPWVKALFTLATLTEDEVKERMAEILGLDPDTPLEGKA